MNRRTTAALLVLVLAGVSCNGGTKFLAPAMPPPISADALRAAPDTMSLVGFGSVITVDLHRDFMPMAPPDGNPMTATVTFSLISPSDFTSNVKSSYVWVVNGNDVWRAALVMRDPQLYPHDEVVLDADDGPKWGPDIQVDVILGFMIEGRGLQLVRLPGVTIKRTD